MIFFIVAFSEKTKNKNGKYERKYYEANTTVKLTSKKEDAKKLINSYAKDLAIFALSEGSDSYTLKITE